MELARERGHNVDVDGYRAEMERHREISRGTGEKGLAQRAADFAQAAGFATEFVGYAKVDVLTQLGALEDLGDGTFLAKLRESPFYPAGGGQVTDHGWIERDDDAAVRAELIDAYRFDADQVLVFRGARLCGGRPRARRRAVGRPVPDHGEPHRDPPPPGGAPRGARRARRPGGLGRAAGQAAVRLHARLRS